MGSLLDTLSLRIEAATGTDSELRPSTKPQFGHFQCNVALRLAAEQGRKPREVAQEIVDKLDLDDLCEPLEIAGPGFINIRVRPSVLAEAVTEQLADPHCGITQTTQPDIVVVDYSSPNVAKQMHVGHLRSTIIGDCLTRVLRACGHTVIPQNHIGDWGRQFGILIEQIADEGLDLDALDLAGAEELYLRANNHLKADPAFADRARTRVVALQAGDEDTLAVWRKLIEISEAGFSATYARLGVLLTDDDIAGESIYNDMLPEICADLEARGIAVIDKGALVVFVPGIKAPAILRNSTGGYGYDVTDLAAIKYRLATFGATRLIYVTDARQNDHFMTFFAVARMAGYLPEQVKAEHIGFGMVLGPDSTPFKTREGTAVYLDDLLNEAEAVAALKARENTAARLDDLLDEAETLSVPEVALATIKYADLSSQLQKDYVFDVNRMTATTGDTGPYLQYAHARVSRILRRAEADGGLPDEKHVTVLADPAEQGLALLLTRFSSVVAEVATELTPHKLCGYLFELASSCSSFYEQCPVLKSEGEVRASRLVLCQATQRVLATGLGLLGIHAPEVM